MSSQFVKDLAKRLPYPIFLNLFYAWYWLQVVRPMSSLRKQLGVKLLSELYLARIKKSDTLVILGSGASINQITAEQWQALAEHDTLGLNFWLLHPFVPRIYAFETISAEAAEMAGFFRRISQARAAEYAPVLKIATNLTPNFICPEQWKDDLYTFYPVPAPAQNEQQLAAGICRLRSKGLFERTSRIRYLYKQASSLSWCIAFAIAAGYQKIILCGVDLRDSMCFYHDRELYPEACGIEFHPRDSPHATESPLPWRPPISQVIHHLNQELLLPRQIQIFVINRTSALWPVIPELSRDFFN